MKRFFPLVAAVLLVLGCSKKLPTDSAETRGSKDVKIVFSGESVQSPKFGSNIKSDWDKIDMTVIGDSSAEITVNIIPGRTYRVNVEFSPDNWAADGAGTHGKITVDGKELTNIEDNGLGGKNFLLSVE